MTFSLRTAILVMIVLFALAVNSCIPQVSKLPGTPPAHVTIAGTEVRQLQSSVTGRSYDIYIRLPDEYTLKPWKKYPVLYVLDGQWDFKLLDSIYGGLYYDKSVPEMIIAGITYTGENPEYGALRAMDYTPVADLLMDPAVHPSSVIFSKTNCCPLLRPTMGQIRRRGC